MQTRPSRIVLAMLAVLFVGLLDASPRLRARAALPTRLSDAEFWQLTEELSEPNGFFRSDNFLSNETGYQYVIPDLTAQVKPGGVYMGVAPEINFTYIAAVKPAMAFIVDIRRGNLHEHLLYKALFELSADRAEFLSKLFSRKRPAGLTAQTSVDELFAAYDPIQASEELFQENLKAVLNHLTRTHEFKLRTADPDGTDAQGIEYVYREAFFKGGPYLNYSFGRAGGMGGRGGGGRGGNNATYEALMLSTDGTGRNRSFLASDENFRFVKEFEEKNLLVPLVGDFGGPKVIRAVGNYVREHGGIVTTFYLSNVEQYLLQDGIWDPFCASVATLPLDDTSTYIFSGGGPSSGGRYGGGRGNGMGLSRMRPIQSEVAACGAR